MVDVRRESEVEPKNNSYEFDKFFAYERIDKEEKV